VTGLAKLEGGARVGFGARVASLTLVVVAYLRIWVLSPVAERRRPDHVMSSICEQLLLTSLQACLRILYGTGAWTPE
jgi:hypothetical protein